MISLIVSIAIVGLIVYLVTTLIPMPAPFQRAIYIVAAVGLLLYQWRIVWPRMWKNRQEYIDHADEPDVANPALDRFERYQGELANVLIMLLAVLLGMVLFSAAIRQVVAVPVP